jgi:predicted transcriptional regulator YheO
MQENETISQTLIQIAEAIVNTFPRNFEVVVHDLAKPKASIKYIAGDVTRRKPGAPVTDLVVKALHREGRDIRDRYNYKTNTKDGRTLKSTTMFIRNSAGDVVNAFCINFDMTDYLNATTALDIFVSTGKEFNGQEQPETFATNIQETLNALFEQAVSKIGKQPVSLSTEEKVQFVAELEATGAFQFKGAVDQIALMIGVSKYTVYNYLKKVHAEKSVNKF